MPTDNQNPIIQKMLKAIEENNLGDLQALKQKLSVLLENPSSEEVIQKMMEAIKDTKLDDFQALKQKLLVLLENPSSKEVIQKMMEAIKDTNLDDLGDLQAIEEKLLMLLENRIPKEMLPKVKEAIRETKLNDLGNLGDFQALKLKLLELINNQRQRLEAVEEILEAVEEIIEKIVGIIEENKLGNLGNLQALEKLLLALGVQVSEVVIQKMLKAIEENNSGDLQALARVSLVLENQLSEAVIQKMLKAIEENNLDDLQALEKVLLVLENQLSQAKAISSEDDDSKASPLSSAYQVSEVNPRSGWINRDYNTKKGNPPLTPLIMAAKSAAEQKDESIISFLLDRQANWVEALEKLYNSVYYCEESFTPAEAELLYEESLAPAELLFNIVREKGLLSNETKMDLDEPDSNEDEMNLAEPDSDEAEDSMSIFKDTNLLWLRVYFTPPGHDIFPQSTPDRPIPARYLECDINAMPKRGPEQDKSIPWMLAIKDWDLLARILETDTNRRIDISTRPLLEEDDWLGGTIFLMGVLLVEESRHSSRHSSGSEHSWAMVTPMLDRILESGKFDINAAVLSKTSEYSGLTAPWLVASNQGWSCFKKILEKYGKEIDIGVSPIEVEDGPLDELSKSILKILIEEDQWELIFLYSLLQESPMGDLDLIQYLRNKVKPDNPLSFEEVKTLNWKALLHSAIKSLSLTSLADKILVFHVLIRGVFKLTYPKGKKTSEFDHLKSIIDEIVYKVAEELVSKKSVTEELTEADKKVAQVISQSYYKTLEQFVIDEKNSSDSSARKEFKVDDLLNSVICHIVEGVVFPESAQESATAPPPSSDINSLDDDIKIENPEKGLTDLEALNLLRGINSAKAEELREKITENIKSNGGPSEEAASVQYTKQLQTEADALAREKAQLTEELEQLKLQVQAAQQVAAQDEASSVSMDCSR